MIELASQEESKVEPVWSQQFTIVFESTSSHIRLANKVTLYTLTVLMISVPLALGLVRE